MVSYYCTVHFIVITFYFPLLFQNIQFLNKHFFPKNITGSKANGVRAVSPATSKMLLKTIRDSDSTSQELHICAIFCSAKSIQLLHQVETVQDFLYELDMKTPADAYTVRAPL